MKDKTKSILKEYIIAVSLIFIIVWCILVFTDIGKHNYIYNYNYDNNNCTISHRKGCKFLGTEKICFSVVTIKKYDYNINNLICECNLNNCYL